eukprot:c19970_g1_i1 orf=1-1038(-)
MKLLGSLLPQSVATLHAIIRRQRLPTHGTIPQPLIYALKLSYHLRPWSVDGSIYTMVKPVQALERAHGELAPLKIVSFHATQAETAPLPQLEALWHYECVVSPRSPAASPHSCPASPRSPAASVCLEPAEGALSPLSPAAKLQASNSSQVSTRSPAGAASVFSPVAHSPPLSPRSPAASSSRSPSSLSRFAPAAAQALQRVFRTFDENGDGSVSSTEISSILEKLGISTSEYSIQSLLAGLVTKSQGQVDEAEFLLLYESVCCFVEQLDASASSSSVDADMDEDLLAAFHVFDKDGNGFISPVELQSVLCSLGFPQARQLEACVDMVARVDENGDGQIDFFEFKKL